MVKSCSICGYTKPNPYAYEGVDLYHLSKTETRMLCFKCYTNYLDWQRVKRGKTTVAIAGGFDPFHQGHLDHIKKAIKLGDFLVVMVSNDEDMIRKKGKCNIPLQSRIEILELILKGLNYHSMVVATLDSDGTQTKTLTMLRPEIFAKGGDRVSSNMPEGELKICQELGIKIVYGVGDLLNSSSGMIL